MNLIQHITSNALQKQTLSLPDGTTFILKMYYIPMQYGWFITSLTYQSFALNGIRITNNANILYQFQNILPFGLGCFSTSQREPTQAQDFSSGASSLYILTQAECQAYAAYIRGGPIPA